MTKKKTTTNEQPDFMAELLETGTTILTAPTLEELAEIANTIEADCIYGAAGRNRETGLFTLRVDLNYKP